MKAKKNFRIIPQVFILLLLAVSICSCAVLNQDALLKINQGMKKDEVAKLMGTPDYRRFDGNTEEWEYRRKVLQAADYREMVIIVTFSGDRVTSLDSFQDYHHNLQPVVSPLPPFSQTSPPFSQTPVYTRGMYEPDFAALLAKVKREPFKDDKLKLLRLAAENNPFSCRQCVTLMSAFTFDDEKLQVVSILAPQIADKENYKEIIDALSFISSREKAEKMLGIPIR